MKGYCTGFVKDFAKRVAEEVEALDEEKRELKRKLTKWRAAIKNSSLEICKFCDNPFPDGECGDHCMEDMCRVWSCISCSETGLCFNRSNSCGCILCDEHISNHKCIYGSSSGSEESSSEN